MTAHTTARYFSDFFHFESGHLFCEDVRVEEIRESLTASCFPPSPFFMYSQAQIHHNVTAYLDALQQQTFTSQLNFAVKANPNVAILKEIKKQGCSLTLVSGMELKLALSLNFDPSFLVFNGNGKTDWEVELAVRENVLLNIDGKFNLEQTIRICKRLHCTANILLRINPNISVDAHKYIVTGAAGSKFGVNMEEMEGMLADLRMATEVRVVGLHCHLGSTIDNVRMYRNSVRIMVEMFKDMKWKGFTEMKYLNIGGGLGIPYTRHAPRTTPFLPCDVAVSKQIASITSDTEIDSQIIRDIKTGSAVSQYDLSSEMERLTDEGVIKEDGSTSGRLDNSPDTPSPADLVSSFSDLIEDDMVVIVEPGRSLVGNAAILVTSVLGCKRSGDTNFVVTDGAMTEVIRPSLYGAYHHIDLTQPTGAAKQLYDVVGPVCESGDFLGKQRLLSTPRAGCGLAVFDVGAYCASMASNYNLRLRPAEVLVEGRSWTVVRRPDTFDDLIRPYIIK